MVITNANHGTLEGRKDNTAWEQVLNITGSQRGDRAGYAVSLSDDGKFKAVGFPGANAQTGLVRVYQLAAQMWMQVGDDITGDFTGDEFGSAVALSSDGSIVSIGAPKSSTRNYHAGQVKVFQYADGVWNMIGSPIYGDEASDLAGFAVAIADNGNVIAMGSPQESRFNAGSVKVFGYSAERGDWELRGGEFIQGDQGGDRCGQSLSLSADSNVLAIGCPGRDNHFRHAGRVLVMFWNDDGGWRQQGQPIEGDSQDASAGTSISLSNDGQLIGVGIPGYSKGLRSHAGAVRILQFDEASGTWVRQGKDMIGLRSDYKIGNSVSLSSNGAIVAFDAGPHYDRGTHSGGQVALRHFDDRSMSWIPLCPNLVLHHVSSYYKVDLNGVGDGVVVGFDNQGRSGVAVHLNGASAAVI